MSALSESAVQRIYALLVVGLGVLVWTYSSTFPNLEDGHPGPALFPRVIAVGLVLAGVGLLVARVDNSGLLSVLRPEDRFGWLRISGALVVVTFFPWLRMVVGFIAALSILGIVVSIMLGSRLRLSIPIVVVSALLIYLLFTRLLGVPL